jgi:hypothetical protein
MFFQNVMFRKLLLCLRVDLFLPINEAFWALSDLLVFFEDLYARTGRGLGLLVAHFLKFNGKNYQRLNFNFKYANYLFTHLLN